MMMMLRHAPASIHITRRPGTRASRLSAVVPLVPPCPTPGSIVRCTKPRVLVIPQGYNSSSRMMSLDLDAYPNSDQDLLFVSEHMFLVPDILSPKEHQKLVRSLPKPDGSYIKSSFESPYLSPEAKGCLENVKGSLVTRLKQGPWGPLELTHKRVRHYHNINNDQFHVDGTSYDLRVVVRLPVPMHVHHASERGKSSSLFIRKHETCDGSRTKRNMTVTIPTYSAYIMDRKISRGKCSHAVPGTFTGHSIIFTFSKH